MLRFLATGDLQAHAWQQFSYTLPNGMNSRLANCLKVFSILGREAKARKISKVLLNGDLFEETDYINVSVYDGVYRKLEWLHSQGLETVVNLGNHDISLQSGHRVLHSLRPFRKVSTVVEEPKLVWGSLHVVPWMSSPEALKQAIRNIQAEKSMGLALHCGVQGATAGPKAYLVRNPIKLRDVRPAAFACVLLSDFHTTQALSGNTWYLGSPLQHTFGETHTPSIWDIRLLGAPPWFRADKIPTRLPRFRGLHLKELGSLRAKLNSWTGDYVRIRLAADSNIKDEEIEGLVAGRFLFQIERAGEELESKPSERMHSLHPDEAISRYARAHANGSSRTRLTSLGKELYTGSL